MTTFDEREQAFENLYKHDQERLFRILARRAKLMGLWAAEQMGLSGGEADAYAMQIVDSDFNEPHHQDTIQRLHTDLTDRGVDISDSTIKKQMGDFLEEARRQVMQS